MIKSVSGKIIVTLLLNVDTLIIPMDIVTSIMIL